jgi:tetratricopeptide (TPR) repeat protein
MLEIFRNVLLLFFLSLILFPQTVTADDCARAGKLAEEARQNLATNLPAAEQLFREASALCGKSASLQYNLGGVLLSSGKVAPARAAFEEALRLKPNYAKAVSSLAALLYEHTDQEYNRALKLARDALSLEPNSSKIRDTLELIEANVDVPLVMKANNADAIAVVIGNRAYSASGIPAVEYAIRDAETVKKYLIDSLGFREKNIIFRKDAKYTDMLTVFGDSADYKGLVYNYARQGKSDIFIYYSGHGAPDTNSKKAYLAPSDMNPNAIKRTSYSLDQLYINLGKLAQEKKTRSITVVLDACFSGASDRGMIIQNASPLTMEVTPPSLSIENGAVITSSRSDQISSWYPEQKHGLFTYHFLKSVKEILASGDPLTVAAIEQKISGTPAPSQWGTSAVT